MLDLYLIRHGETELNKTQNIIGGRSPETALSDRGIYQAELLGKRLKAENAVFDKVYSSTSKRAEQTALIACNIIGFDLSKIIVSEQLEELSQGSWEGLRRDELYTPEVLREINSKAGQFRPPEGESQMDVEARMSQFINYNLASLSEQDITAAVFSHGMAIKCFLRYVLGSSPKMTYKIVLDNTSITRLKYNELGWHLVSINDSSHIGSDKLKTFYC
jgi:broad specificity phosphatase PhoE